ncbi:kinase-like domain-containing protein [Hypoxylon argillaceum]|nr:kinase-like domain-containing protein [Hypoxylon argillaceum]
MNYIQSSETDLFRDRFLMTGTILGRGAFTDVHLAINLKTGQQVACKIHRIDQFRQSLWSTSIIRRIVDETNILSRLTHPNLLKFEAAFRSPDTLYTFTELATGGDLFSVRLRYPDGVPELDTKVIIRQIVEAVSYLHDQNVAHRDLKPENVFLATGPTIMTRVIVGDFGEVYRGQSYGIEVDIWSIGMISLFLVAPDWNNFGCLEAFAQNIVDEILIDIFDELSNQHKALSNNFEDFIKACLVTAPKKRMTAKFCKGHNWFRSSGPRLKHQMEEFTKGWEPATIVHNSVEDLDLFESIETHNPLYTMDLDKRNAQGDRKVIGDSQQSYYFTKNNSTGHKQLIADREILVFSVTTPSGDTQDIFSCSVIKRNS